VYTPPLITGLDTKFGDQVNNLWYHHSSEPLKNTIIRYSVNLDEKMNLSTSWNDRQPRLLVIAVDVEKGETVTFDSYHKKEDPNNQLYDGDGIGIDQIMASGTLPEFYDFQKIGDRQFCDGGLISNTPFRELLQAHQEYWLRIIDRDKQKIPDLEIYIINDHPSRGTAIPKDDHDRVVDRINDIKFLDRNSLYDENAFNAITDHVTIIDKLKDLARIYIAPDKLNEFENDYKKFLKLTKAKSKLHPKEVRMYRDVIDSRFGLTKVIRIENMDYKDSISGKTADFTSKSIRDLIALGYSDALKCLDIKTEVEKSRIYQPEIIR
ncbi:MAG TPA: patatin-like phospholipase family protein, partial [Nitrososphaeraceae archaeon]